MLSVVVKMQIDSFFEKPELKYSEVLQVAEELKDKDTGVIKSIHRAQWYSDEPDINVFTVRIGNTNRLGSEVSPETFHTGTHIQQVPAAVKAVGEALERYSSGFYSREQMTYDSYENLENALKPSDATKFSREQLKNQEKARFDTSDDFWWTEGYNLLDSEKIYIPAQLVFMPYKINSEPLIRNPISTGLAAGTNTGSALFRGFCEVIERDAFIISYLNHLEIPEIDKSSIKDEETKKLIERVEEKDIELRIFELPTDMPLEVYMAITVEKSEKGPSIVVGANAHHDTYEAIKDAISETLHTRPWLRQKRMEEGLFEGNPKKINSLKERGLYWFPKSMISELDFWLQKPEKKKLDVHKSSKKESLSKILKKLKENNYQAVYSDITTQELERLGFKVVRVTVPELHPLYLREKFKYLGGERLYDLPVKLGFLQNKKSERDLNQTPQPFL